MTDWGDLYRTHVDALASLAPDLSADQLDTTVPATPLWTVHQVLAHLAGGANDAVTERMDGAPSEEWTSRHVGERAGAPVSELIEELRGNTDALVEAVADSPRPALVWDIAVHHADIHEALSLPRMPEHLWQPIAETLAYRSPELAAAVPAYDLFRGSFSRRSRGQMQAWGTGLSAEELDEVCIFGPREDDQPIPV